MLRQVVLCVVLVLLISGCGGSTPKAAFESYVAAVRAQDATRLMALDANVWERTRNAFKSDREAVASDLQKKLSLPAATASIENGFEQPSCDYAAKAYFPAGAKVAVLDVVQEGQDRAKLQVQVEYPENAAPIYVEDVRVVGAPGGMYITPIPLFDSGILEHGHPFLARPRFRGRYNTFDLKLNSRGYR